MEGASIPLLRLGGFFGHLRRRGMSVGIGAELDLARALAYVSVLDPASFRDACRATLAKSPTDVALLDEAFDEYWFAAPRVPEPEGGVRAPRVPARAPVDGQPRREPSRPPPLVLDKSGVIRIGVYSPEAPPPGHTLAPLDSRRLFALRRGARRFRRFVATLPGRRFEPSRHGRIDFSATSRASLRLGGEWIQVRRRRRKRHRAELVVLWDVSGSMREHDSDLFALVHALHRTAPRSRVFAFSTELEEITPVLRGLSYRHTLDAVTRFLGPAGGGTQIGRCLREFQTKCGALVRSRTTVVVISDGWDLGDVEPLRRTLEWIRRQAHLLAWVNPYARTPRFRPATAAMSEALPYVDALLAPEDFASPRPFRMANVRPAA